MLNLILIPARGGSIGIKNKNLKIINKKPLVHHTIDIALKILGNNKIVLSTDSKKIINKCKKYKKLEIPYIRPKNLSTSNARVSDVALDVIKYYSKKNFFFDYLILLEPTSPLRDLKQINYMVSDVIKKKIKSAFAVCDVWHHPSEYIGLKNKNIYFYDKNIESNRQEYPKIYFVTGALYIIDVKFFYKNKKFISKKSVPYKLSPYTMFDIDKAFDLEITRCIFSHFKKNKKKRTIRLV
jgi:CMP-N-acetylneuraminic acid synthetase